MNIKFIALSAIFAAASFGLADSPESQQAEAAPLAPTTRVDFSKYSTAPELDTAHHGGTCTTFNEGTPFCYMMCSQSPRLRACDD